MKTNRSRNHILGQSRIVVLFALLWVLQPIHVLAQEFQVNGLKYQPLDGATVSLIDGKGVNGEVVIPETVTYEGTEYAVVEIADEAFYNSEGMTSVIVPQSITNIGRSAFYGCNALKYIEIADGDTPLSFSDNYQFRVSPLDSAYIGRDLEYGGSSKYKGVSPFVGTRASQYTPIRKVEFGDSVRAIGKSLFQYCVSLERVIIGKNVTDVANKAFDSCSGLSVVNCKALIPPTCSNSSEFKSTSAALYVPEKTLESYRNAKGWTNFAKIFEGTPVPDFIVGGIKYTVIDQGEVGVVALSDDTKYEGDLVLPESVIHKEVTYKLTTICSGAFNGCNGLNSVLIPATVTTIEELAFANCSMRIECKALTPPVCVKKSFSNVSDKVYIPQGTLELYQTATGWKDFAYLIDATYVPDFTVDGIIYTQLGKDRVGIKGPNDKNMIPSKITLPDTVEHEGITYHVTVIMEEAFRFCYSLQYVEFPKNLTAIESEAFSGCRRLRSIALSENLKTLGLSAFQDCYDLTKVSIPAGVTTIEQGTFNHCPLDTMIVKSMTPPTVRGDYALGDKYDHGVLIVPTGALRTYMNAEYWKDFFKIEEESGNSNVFEVDGVFYKLSPIAESIIVSAVGASASEIVIPDSVVYDKKYAVKTIAERAFGDNENLTSVVISEGVTTLGSNAFANCCNLRSISIPSTLVNGNFGYTTDYGSYNYYYPAFYGCTGLEKITVADGHPNLDSRKDCNALILTKEDSDKIELIMGCKNTVIPDGVTSIASSAFYCTGLKEVNIPNSVTEIGQNAFALCEELETVRIGSGADANFAYDFSSIFSCCINLRTIEVDEANPLFDSRNNCNAIILKATNTLVYGCNETKIPDGVTSIAPTAFYYSPKLKELIIPASVTSIGSSSFYGCSELTSITVDKANPVYDSRNNCNAIIKTEGDTLVRGCMSTIIPDEIKVIGNYAFCHSLGLEEIVIPDAVQSIGDEAFLACRDLKSITIGAGVQVLGNNIFFMQSNSFIPSVRLSTIILKGGTPPVFTNLNPGFTSEMPIYIQLVVPEGALAAYQSADIWQKFTHITEGECAVEFEYDGIYYRIITGSDNAVVRPHFDEESFSWESTYTDSIVIPETVWYNDKEYVVNAIDEFAFYNARYTFLSIPATVKEIEFNGLDTFDGTILCYATIPPVFQYYNAFGVTYETILRIPKESMELYEKDNYWGQFWIYGSNIEAIEDANGIENTETEIFHTSTNVVYDLSGRRMLDTENLKGGIYIVNGRKIVIK